MTLRDIARQVALRFLLIDEHEDEPEPEPEPEPEQRREKRADTQTLPTYRTTLTYRNGDTETFYSHGIFSKGEESITFTMGLKGKRTWGHGTAFMDFDCRQVSIHLLAREPELEKVAEETWVLSYEVIDDYAQRDSLDLNLVHATRPE